MTGRTDHRELTLGDEDARRSCPGTTVHTERERVVSAAFVAIADSLVSGYDIVDLYNGLTRDCAQILDVAAAGLMLADGAGVLHVVGASSEHSRKLGLFTLQSEQGPCLECFRSGEIVAVPDLRCEVDRWPHFVPAALAEGFASVHAVPMRLQNTVLGALGLFGPQPGVLNHEDLVLGQALAYVASVALIADKAGADKDLINEHLQIALTSRIVLEQAKDIVGQLGNLDMEQAFAVLRRYSRDHNLRLSDIALAVVSRELPAQLLVQHALAKGVVPKQPTN